MDPDPKRSDQGLHCFTLHVALFMKGCLIVKSSDTNFRLTFKHDSCYLSFPKDGTI